MLLSVIPKNLNWEVVTRIQLLLKDGMGVKDGKCKYYVGSLEGQSPNKKQYKEEELRKKMGGGGGGEKG